LAAQEEEERAASGALMSTRGEREGSEDGWHYSKKETHSKKLGQAKGEVTACGGGWAGVADWAGWAEWGKSQ
jgi:hypothetical protein